MQCRYCGCTDNQSAPAAPKGGVVDVPRVTAKASDEELIGYLDDLLAGQARLMFAKGNCDDAEAEAFGVAILDFMRLHGLRLRQILVLRTTPTGQGEG